VRSRRIKRQRRRNADTWIWNETSLGRLVSLVATSMCRDLLIEKVSWVEVWGGLTAQGTTRGYTRDRLDSTV
jgi:hypothetical protein